MYCSTSTWYSSNDIRQRQRSIFSFWSRLIRRRRRKKTIACLLACALYLSGRVDGTKEKGPSFQFSSLSLTSPQKSILLYYCVSSIILLFYYLRHSREGGISHHAYCDVKDKSHICTIVDVVIFRYFFVNIWFGKRKRGFSCIGGRINRNGVHHT